MLGFSKPYAIFITSAPRENCLIRLQNVSFKYDALQKTNTLDNLNFDIQKNKITAIVGSSGSGKTTLLKLLLKFYNPTKGHIIIGDTQLQTISPESWRANSGVVMQEGYIFSDTIENNIAVGQEKIDLNKLHEAAYVANIHEFINELPLGYKTQVGNEGIGLSTGQKQRLLIARAVYKNPAYLFFDEATSALDTNNEKIIMNNLNKFFKGRTVVIIAHRLSTVKSADQIIVLDKGKILEQGIHNKLVVSQGAYFELVKNQLELGS